ncbi:hypothetical protein HK102_010684, partial [Quaeritorhiza haematococci]
ITMPRLVELDGGPVRDLEYYFSRCRRTPARASQAESPTPTDAESESLTVSPTVSPTTLRLLRPGLGSFNFSKAQRLLVSPTDADFGNAFMYFAHPGLVSLGSDYKRDAWRFNGERVPIETMWHAIQEVCVAVVNHLPRDSNPKGFQKAQRYVQQLSRIKTLERHLRRVMSVHCCRIIDWD